MVLTLNNVPRFVVFKNTPTTILIQRTLNAKLPFTLNSKLPFTNVVVSLDFSKIRYRNAPMSFKSNIIFKIWDLDNKTT